MLKLLWNRCIFINKIISSKIPWQMTHLSKLTWTKDSLAFVKYTLQDKQRKYFTVWMNGLQLTLENSGFIQLDEAFPGVANGLCYVISFFF
jgi:hypothetical protein